MFEKLNIDIDRDKRKYLIIFTTIVVFLFLGKVAYDNADMLSQSKEKDKVSIFNDTNFIPIKEFLLSKINSPFLNLNYEIKKGDTIEKILKKNNIENTEIQNIIAQYKKYSNPNQLYVGNLINIVVKKGVNKDTIATTRQ